MTRTTFLITVEHSKPLPPDFADKVGGRIYTLEEVEKTGCDVTEHQGWHPIENAPKDGTEIWAYWMAGGVNTVSSGTFGCTVFLEGRWRNPEDDNDYFIPPSHWMPLPAAPKE